MTTKSTTKREDISFNFAVILGILKAVEGISEAISLNESVMDFFNTYHKPYSSLCSYMRQFSYIRHLPPIKDTALDFYPHKLLPLLIQWKYLDKEKNTIT